MNSSLLELDWLPVSVERTLRGNWMGTVLAVDAAVEFWESGFVVGNDDRGVQKHTGGTADRIICILL